MDNPYSAPEAEVQDRSADSPARPVLVWIIFVFAMVVTVFGVIGFAGLALMHVKHIPFANPAERAYVNSVGIIDYVIAGLVYGFFAAGAITLFRLRKVAVNLYMVYLPVRAIGAAYKYSKPSYQAFIGAGPHLGNYIGWAIALAIAAYAFKLRRDGVLR